MFVNDGYDFMCAAMILKYDKGTLDKSAVALSSIVAGFVVHAHLFRERAIQAFVNKIK